MNIYSENRKRTGRKRRVVTEMPEELVEEIDAWGVPAGKESRTDAVLHLVKRGLEAESAAAGVGRQTQAPAAEIETAARQRGVSINPGCEGAQDEYRNE